MVLPPLKKGDDGSGNRYAVRAFADSYTVRIICDGDELTLPFSIRKGHDYEAGDRLEQVAARVARSLMDDEYGVAREVAIVRIYADEPVRSCTDDDEPEPLATAEAWSE